MGQVSTLYGIGTLLYSSSRWSQPIFHKVVMKGRQHLEYHRWQLILRPKYMLQACLKSSLGKLYGQHWDLIKQYEESLSKMLHDILEDDHIHWHPPLIRQCTKLRPCCRSIRIFDLFCNCMRFPWNICNRCGMQKEHTFTSDTWSFTSLVLACVLK